MASANDRDNINAERDINNIDDLYQRYARPLLRKAERLLRNSDDAQDVVHGLFADLMNRPLTNIELPYLYRAVTNRCLNLLRDTKNRKRILEAHQSTLSDVVPIRCDEQIIEWKWIGTLAKSLNRKCLEVFVYRYVDEMSQEEIAQVLSISRRMVGKRLAKIRAAVDALNRKEESQ